MFNTLFSFIIIVNSVVLYNLKKLKKLIHFFNPERESSVKKFDPEIRAILYRKVSVMKEMNEKEIIVFDKMN